MKIKATVAFLSLLVTTKPVDADHKVCVSVVHQSNHPINPAHDSILATNIANSLSAGQPPIGAIKFTKSPMGMQPMPGIPGGAPIQAHHGEQHHVCTGSCILCHLKGIAKSHPLVGKGKGTKVPMKTSTMLAKGVKGLKKKAKKLEAKLADPNLTGAQKHRLLKKLSKIRSIQKSIGKQKIGPGKHQKKLCKCSCKKNMTQSGAIHPIKLPGVKPVVMKAHSKSSPKCKCPINIGDLAKSKHHHKKKNAAKMAKYNDKIMKHVKGYCHAMNKGDAKGQEHHAAKIREYEKKKCARKIVKHLKAHTPHLMKAKQHHKHHLADKKHHHRDRKHHHGDKKHYKKKQVMSHGVHGLSHKKGKVIGNVCIQKEVSTCHADPIVEVRGSDGSVKMSSIVHCDKKITQTCGKGAENVFTIHGGVKSLKSAHKAHGKHGYSKHGKHGHGKQSGLKGVVMKRRAIVHNALHDQLIKRIKIAVEKTYHKWLAGKGN